MGRAAITSTEARLEDLAAAFAPVPAQIAALDANVKHWEHLAAALEPLPAEVAVLISAVERLTDENRALRSELAATERAMLQISWGLVAALLGAAAALITALA